MHNHTFKPGDLAVISRIGNTRYIGAVVRLEERDASGAFDWIVEFLGGPVFGRDMYTRQLGMFSHGPVWEWNLSPLAAAESDLLAEQEADYA
ncbi:hypothetical protein [Burkholderia gladioli]|uniref:hypothetical protein n=1 Tax=Burkholderia gladioli TaxID=28095 RepID=UPI0016422F84|nr:hypothetical protein [Burkholderia gladioli]MBJ9675240.1 hypothetical protein [Burkholderia gladioli]MDN7463492.1 hypothetical protein [Burkholderia gladioli]